MPGAVPQLAPAVYANARFCAYQSCTACPVLSKLLVIELLSILNF